MLGNAILHRWELTGVVEPAPEELHEAGAAFEKALEVEPRLTQALAGAGSVALRSGDTRKAQRYFEAAAAASPGDPGIEAALAECRRRNAAAPGWQP